MAKFLNVWHYNPNASWLLYCKIEIRSVVQSI
jgi:hypothetical protein